MCHETGYWNTLRLSSRVHARKSRPREDCVKVSGQPLKYLCQMDHKFHKHCVQVRPEHVEWTVDQGSVDVLLRCWHTYTCSLCLSKYFEWCRTETFYRSFVDFANTHTRIYFCSDKHWCLEVYLDLQLCCSRDTNFDTSGSVVCELVRNGRERHRVHCYRRQSEF